MLFRILFLVFCLGIALGEAPVNADTYTNPLPVAGAWPDYGTGDPFVLRFNGEYFLYVSTKDGRPGIRVWSSADLVAWEPRGFCTDDPSTTGAYAPEATYGNGWFWLATSPAGSGHRFYRSRSPLGPFERFTDNLGMSIDGSFFRDEDGRLLFYHASPRGILGHELASDGTPGPEVLLPGTWMGHWTEGPFVLQKDGLWFLGLTGNNVFSPGYRENYAVGESGPLGPFVQPDNNPLLLNTSPAFHGLGHASAVLGPDLVSYWLAYHNLEGTSAEGPPLRGLNLDRLLFNGRRLAILGPTNFPRPVPEGPTRAWTPGSLGPEPLPGRFTAETTFLALPEGGGVRWGDNGASNRLLWLDPTSEVRAEVSFDGAPSVLVRRPLFAGFDFTVAHTVRLEATDSDTTVWIDGWKVFALPPEPMAGALSLVPGGPGFRAGWTGWSAGGFDEADRRQVHPLPARLQGVHGLTDPGVLTTDGWSLGRALARGADLVYRILVPASGRHGFSALVRGALPQGVALRLDDQALDLGPQPPVPTPGRVTLTDDWLLIDLGSARLPAGEHLLEVRVPPVPGLVWDGLTVEPRAAVSDPVDAGVEVNAGLYGWVGNPLQDVRYRVTVERKAAGPDLFGLVVRGSQMSRHPDQVADGFFGYKVALSGGTVTLTRVQYERQKILGTAVWKCPVGTPVALEVTIQGGQIRVGPVGETPWIGTFDPVPLPPGQAGWYTSSGRVRFSGLSLSEPDLLPEGR